MEEVNVELIKEVHLARKCCLKGRELLRKLPRVPGILHEDAVLYSQVVGKARAVLWPSITVGGRTGYW